MNPDIIKISALSIKDKKVLLVKAEGKDFWSSLGGKIENNEEHVECLKREIKEEINLNLVSATLYLEAPIVPTDNNDGRTIKNFFYIVETSGETQLNPDDQIKEYKWLSKDEFVNRDFKIGTALERFAIPKLIKDGLI
ncbi:MAG: NUDIX domain-containing protein [Candidatus Dojkabacteria bacterium]